MTTEGKTVLVTGASGRIGGAVVRELLSRQQVTVRAAVRDPQKAKPLADAGAQPVHFDYDQLDSFAPALDGVESLFLLTGYTVDMLRHSKRIVDAARRAGVRRVVHAGTHSPDDTDDEHHGWHQFVERYIEWSGIAFTHLRPGGYIQSAVESSAESLRGQQGLLLDYRGGAPFSWVDTDDVARVAAVVLGEGTAHAGKTYAIAAETVSLPEVAATLTQTLGRPYRCEVRSSDEFAGFLDQAGFERVYARSVVEEARQFASGAWQAWRAGYDTVQRLTGEPAVTWAEYARRHPDQFEYRE